MAGTAGQAGSRDRVTIQEAARRLGVKEAAIRKRIQRGTLEHEPAFGNEDGRTYVYLYTGMDEGMDAGRTDSEARVEDLHDQISYLREQLAEERESRRRADHIIAALTERIPELEAPPASAQEAESVARSTSEGSGGEETSESNTGAHSESSPPSERRSWWRRILGQ